jgi:hypothetical protein
LDDVPFPPFANPLHAKRDGLDGQGHSVLRLRYPAAHGADPVRTGTSAKSKGASSLVLALNTLDPAPCLAVNKFAVTKSVLLPKCARTRPIIGISHGG